MTKYDATQWYADVLKAWQVKAAGSKPTASMCEVAHAFGKPGKQSLALAMCLRPEGASDKQIKAAMGWYPGNKPGRSQNNHKGDLVKAKLFDRLPVSANAEGHTVYKMALTASGKAAMARRAKPEAEPVKPVKVKPEPVKADKPETVKVKKAPGKAKRKPKAEPVINAPEVATEVALPEVATEVQVTE